MDERERELLQHQGMDVRDLLAQSEGEGIQAESTMIKSLEESIDHFEIAYPDLTMLLNQLLSILSSAGI